MDIDKIRIADVEYNFRDATTLKDAPEDGKLYARKGGKWVPTAQELTPEQLSNIDNIPTKADKAELVALEQRVNASISSETTRATEAEAALHQSLNDLEYKHNMDMETIQLEVGDLTSLAKGAQRALVYADYSKLVTALNAGMVGIDVLPKGQSIYIQQLDVPDLWVSNFRAPDELTEYTYTNDDDFLEYIKGGGWIGCHQLSLLETAKVDLSNTATKTEVTALQAEVAALKAIINEITTKE